MYVPNGFQSRMGQIAAAESLQEGFAQEIHHDLERYNVHQDWMRARIQNVHDHVTAYDVLRANGVALVHDGSEQAEQLSCPFHGNDNRPSARIFPTSATGPSAVWCYVCRKQRDCIACWRDFRGGDMPFSQAVFEVERYFNLVVPDRAEGGPAPPVKRADYSVPLRLLSAAEYRVKESSRQVGREGFAALTVLMDRLWGRIENETITADEATHVVHLILDKVAEKETYAADVGRN